MKKNIVIIVLILVIVFLIGMLWEQQNVMNKLTNGENTAEASANSNKIDKLNSKDVTAEDVANKLKEQIPSIGRIIVYNENNDPNNLLGRPNQYTSKIIFEDTRVEQGEDEEHPEEYQPTGGTIEVFKNKSDMKNRKEYIESLSSSISLFSQYIYSKNNVILRIDSNLSPSQAEEYKSIFENIIK